MTGSQAPRAHESPTDGDKLSYTPPRLRTISLGSAAGPLQNPGNIGQGGTGVGPKNASNNEYSTNFGGAVPVPFSFGS